MQEQSYDVDKLTDDLANLARTKAEVLSSIQALKAELSEIKASRAELQSVVGSNKSSCQFQLNSVVTAKNKKVTELESVVHVLKTNLADKTQKLISKNDEASSLHKKLERSQVRKCELRSNEF